MSSREMMNRYSREGMEDEQVNSPVESRQESVNSDGPADGEIQA